MAVLAAIVGFTHLLIGFDNPTLVQLVTAQLDGPYTSGQATYNLRRLKRKGLIVRLPGRNRYHLTPLGRHVAVLFTKAYGRVLAPGLAVLDPRLPDDLTKRSPLATAWRQLDRTWTHSSLRGSPLHDRTTWSERELRPGLAKLVPLDDPLAGSLRAAPDLCAGRGE